MLRPNSPCSLCATGPSHRLIVGAAGTDAVPAARVGGVTQLRRQIETWPVTWLAAETIRALDMVDELYRGSLSRGNTRAFDR